MKIVGLMKTTLLDYPGHVACTIFTPGCNFRCSYCHNKDLVIPELINFNTFYSEDEIFDFLKSRVGILEGVCITGGEPTLQHDLFDFIKKIKDLGYLVKLDTNGTNCSILVDLIYEKLIDYVAMDIKGGIDCYEKMIPQDNFRIYSNVIETTHYLRWQEKIDYEFRTTVVGNLHTDQDFKEIGRLLSNSLAGETIAKRYYLQYYKESDGVIDKSLGFTTPTKEELLNYLKIVKEYIPNAEIRGIEY